MKEKKKNTSRSSIFTKLSEKIFSMLKGGMFGYFFTSYDEANERYQRTLKRKRAIRSNKTRRKISKTIESSFFVNFIPRLVEYLLTTSTRDYGIALLIMGAVTTILYPLRAQILFINITQATFFAGIVICLCSIPLIISSKSLAMNMHTSQFCNKILFDFLGFDRDKIREISEKNRHFSTNISLLVGLLLGVAAYFAQPTRVIIFLAILVLGYSALKTPEIGVVAIIFSIPFFSVKILTVATVYVFGCYLVKWIIGKRTFKLEYLDIFVIGAMVLVLIRGLISKSISVTFESALLSASLALAYFLITNLIRSKEWFRRCITALVVSGLIVSLIGILQLIIGKISIYVPQLSIIFKNGQSIGSTFNDPLVLGQFLVVLVPFVLVRMLSKRNGMGKFLSFLFLVMVFVAIFATASLPAVIGAIAAALLLLIIYHRNYTYLALILFLALPILYISLPNDIMARLEGLKLFSSFETASIVAEIRHAFQFFIQNPFGVGKGILETSPSYDYTDNLLLQVLIEQGIIVFIGIATLFIMIARMTLSYCAKAKNKYRRINGAASISSFNGILTAGLFTYAFYDERLFLLLWVLTAISFAYMRIERDEEEPRTRRADFTSATIDITLTGENENESIPKRKYVRLPRIRRIERVNEVNDFGLEDDDPLDDDLVMNNEEDNQENDETKF